MAADIRQTQPGMNRATPAGPVSAPARAATGATADPALDGAAQANLAADMAAFYAALANEPWRFDFFQAIRLIDCFNPGSPRTGTASRPMFEALRFTQEPSLGCEGSSIAGYQPGLPATTTSPARPPRLKINFLGLLGTNGPMPLYFTQHVRQRRNHGDHGIARFLDMFHHRMVALFYRAWAMHQRTVAFDRRGDDPYRQYVGSLIGRGTPAFWNRDAVDDGAKLHFAGRLSCPTHHADGLAAILSAYFAVPAQVLPWIGQWIDIPPENRCFLGVHTAGCRLGEDAILGEKTYDYQRRFRVRMGPMRLRDYTRLLPNGDSVRRLMAWVRNYCGDEFDWDVQLVMMSSEVPQIKLGSVGQLGWTTWLANEPITVNRDDLAQNIGDANPPQAGLAA